MWATINGMLQNCGTLLVRLSACLLVLRMPPVGQTKQPHARAIHMLMVVFVVVSTASSFLLYFQCIPLEGLWDRSIHARCIPLKTWSMIQKVDGCKSYVSIDLFSNFLLNKASLRSRHELHDC